LDRADTFFVFDCAGLTANVSTAVSEISTFDNNYAATYYPWVRIVDANVNKPVWVPPTVVIPGVLSFNDRVAAEWYAPAGLNRGGLTSVTDAYSRLTLAERDDLYEGRVNPIATFPGVGVCVWGQKTLQAKPSALDRINVRRLLIAVKKFIASATRYLVFEQNTATTRNRFLNIVNPYLESVQQRQGLYAFRVIMDETNNTPDIIDRNIMYGQIFLQPAKTAEFIIIDFNILPTGASFPE
jgi:phage tail sheath protein FI